jgi:hypothetical protein
LLILNCESSMAAISYQDAVGWLLLVKRSLRSSVGVNEAADNCCMDEYHHRGDWVLRDLDK